MRQLTFVLMVILFSSCSTVNEATPSATSEVETQTVFNIYGFPLDLYCTEVVEGIGPTWENITIGISTLEELTDTLFQRSDDYEVYSYEENEVRFSLFNIHVENANIPISVTACVVDEVIMTLSILPNLLTSVSLEDFIIQYGEPDVVTWSDIETSRVVFWFEEGVVADVGVTDDGYGAISSIVFVPFQPTVGFEERWPYNRTRNTPPLAGDEVFIPPLPTEQNPFDFDAIIATITAQPSRTPPPSSTPILDLYQFPTGLFCSEIDISADTGTIWGNIQLGISSLDELDIYVRYLSNLYQTQGLRGDRVSYYISPTRLAEQEQIPSGITACVIDNTIWLIQVPTSFQQNSPTLRDFIERYGLPDVVSWSEFPTNRVVFWFEHGIAAEVNVDRSNESIEFGIILQITYFPFQDSEGFTQRWPYNRTRSTAPFPGDEVFNPPLPTAQNPFDFDAIIATITAQPSRTSTTATVTP